MAEEEIQTDIYMQEKSQHMGLPPKEWQDAAQRYLHNHTEHHEDIPEGNEDSEIPETQQELSDVVT